VRDEMHRSVAHNRGRNGRHDLLRRVYCGPVLRHSAGAIQAANFSSVVAF
jgi:hypothetical protein